MKTTKLAMSLLGIAAAFASDLTARSGVGVNLGASIQSEGIYHYYGGDGATVAASKGGLDCRSTTTSSVKQYFYFNIDDGFAYNGSRQVVDITVHYFDNGTEALTLQYDSMGTSAYKDATLIRKTNSNTWKSYTWHLTDARLANRQNLGADFRIRAAAGSITSIDLVYIHDFEPEKRRRAISTRQMTGSYDGYIEDPAPFQQLMDRPDLWLDTASKVGMVKAYDYMINHYTDEQLSRWFAFLQTNGILFGVDTGVVKPGLPFGDQAFYHNKQTFDRIISCGGKIDDLFMDEPLTATRSFYKEDQAYAVRETVKWIKLVRTYYPNTRICSIEANPFNGIDRLKSWIEDVNDGCAQQGVEGLDYFALDCHWTMSWDFSNPRDLNNWCRNRGVPFSMIYWAAPADKSYNSPDWEYYILQQGAKYFNGGGRPDQYLVQSWLLIPVDTIPESLPNSFTHSTSAFFGRFGD